MTGAVDHGKGRGLRLSDAIVAAAWLGVIAVVEVPDLVLVVAGVLLGACAVALKRGRSMRPVPPVS